MLKILDFSGAEGATKNLTIYEYGDDIVVVDCGVGFPDSEMLGVDLVIPDMSYLLENSHKIRGLIVTHAHEDHIGAVPHFLANFPDVPVYSSKFGLQYLREKLKERDRYKGLPKNPSLHELNSGDETVDLGVFGVEAFRVNHSIPDSLGISLRTPEGLVLHMSDFKIDLTPEIDEPIELNKIAAYGDEGVLCLLSDCLKVAVPGYSPTEKEVGPTFDILFQEAHGKQIVVTTISSNLSRMYQIIKAAQRVGRRVVLAGYSIRQKVEIARKLGYLPFEDNDFVDSRKTSKYDQSDLVYIAAGSFGQEGSAMDRASLRDNERLNIEPDAYVIFSSTPGPAGVREPVERMQGRLSLLNAHVIYPGIQERLHVSGHGPRGDLRLIASLVKPKYFIPIGGNIIQSKSYEDMVVDLGVDSSRVFLMLEGESVEFKDDNAKKGKTYPVKDVFLDGTTLGDVGPAVLRDREKLSDDGIFVVIVPIDQKTRKLAGDVEVVTRGFVYVRESGDLMNKTKQSITDLLQKHEEGLKDWNNIRDEIEKRMNKMLYKETGRNPLIFIQAIYL